MSFQRVLPLLPVRPERAKYSFGRSQLAHRSQGRCLFSIVGAESCIVEGEFENADESLKSLLEENEVEWVEDGSLIIRRILYSTDRSRSFVNDCPESARAGKMRQLLMNIHSQHNKLILSDKRYQLRVLDLLPKIRSICASECGVNCRIALPQVKAEKSLRV